MYNSSILRLLRKIFAKHIATPLVFVRVRLAAMGLVTTPQRPWISVPIVLVLAISILGLDIKGTSRKWRIVDAEADDLFTGRGGSNWFIVAFRCGTVWYGVEAPRQFVRHPVGH